MYRTFSTTYWLYMVEPNTSLWLNHCDQGMILLIKITFKLFICQRLIHSFIWSAVWSIVPIVLACQWMRWWLNNLFDSSKANKRQFSGHISQGLIWKRVCEFIVKIITTKYVPNRTCKIMIRTYSGPNPFRGYSYTYKSGYFPTQVALMVI